MGRTKPQRWRERLRRVQFHRRRNPVSCLHIQKSRVCDHPRCSTQLRTPMEIPIRGRDCKTKRFRPPRNLHKYGNPCAKGGNTGPRLRNQSLVRLGRIHVLSQYKHGNEIRALNPEENKTRRFGRVLWMMEYKGK